jgi:NAD(P)-dependent dehydrogenase (short-subunit alcohol dehydrogenase family)
MSNRPLALITGANKGIGFAAARLLGLRGVDVILGARDELRGKQAAESLRAEGITASPVHLDVTDSGTVREAAAEIARHHPRLDILVNNAGTAGLFSGTAGEATAEDLRQVYETNVFGVVEVTHAMLPLLLRSQAGRIVNVSSHMGSRSPPTPTRLWRALT